MGSIVTGYVPITSVRTASVALLCAVLCIYIPWVCHRLISNVLSTNIYGLVWLRGRWLGVKTIMVDDPVLAKKILTHISDKGDFIERHASAVAWAPIKSIESEDGCAYEKLRADFNKMHSKLAKRLPELREIAERQCHIFSLSRLDHAQFSRLTLTIMLTFVTGDSDMHTVEALYRGSESWRQELAVKGFGDSLAKNVAVKALRAHLDRQGMQDISVDSVMQPFFISPAINFCDVVAHNFSCPNSQPKRSDIINLILAAHPFPFLERYTTVQIGDVAPATQVYIPLAEMARRAPEPWMAFSVGPRMCPGSNYAICILESMLRILSGHKNFCPSEGHRFSGRHNDRQFGDLLHPLFTFARGVFAKPIIPD
jgi:hypothetical protein